MIFGEFADSMGRLPIAKPFNDIEKRERKGEREGKE